MAILSVYFDKEYGYCALKDSATSPHVWARKCFWTKDAPPTVGVVPLLSEVLEQWGGRLTDVAAVVAPRGPTSFTTQRLISTIARSVKFVAPQADVFMPSQFHVLAYAAKDFIPIGAPFLVVINSHSRGFFGAVLKNVPAPTMTGPTTAPGSTTTGPTITPGPTMTGPTMAIPSPTITVPGSLYDATTCDAFFRGREDLPIVSDCAALCEPYGMPLELPPVNFASVQLDLYESAARDADFDYASFQPYCLDMPSYKKLP
ncbi:MAG: hypothetical protein LBR89_00215 [Holosporales bacterium]|nr:hypothetical protein [Holosporales bacterium]